MNKAIFIDRDGVINKLLSKDSDPENNPHNYIISWDQFEFLPGVFEAFKLLKDTDYTPIVVSNQSGIGRGYVGIRTTRELFGIMTRHIWAATEGSCVEKMDIYNYFCPHTPEDNCACRKPKPGMIYQAAVEHDIDLSQSWMIGDSDTDIEAGHNAGISNLIKVGGKLGNSKELADLCIFSDVSIAPSLLNAVKYIIHKDEHVVNTELHSEPEFGVTTPGYFSDAINSP